MPIVIIRNSQIDNPLRLYTRYIEMYNEEAYKYYRISFTDECDPDENSMQLAEVVLFGS